MKMYVINRFKINIQTYSYVSCIPITSTSTRHSEWYFQKKLFIITLNINIHSPPVFNKTEKSFHPLLAGLLEL